MAKYRYSYIGYKGFPSATEASRKLSLLMILVGMIIVPLAAGFGILVAEEVIGENIVVIAVGVVCGFLLSVGLIRILYTFIADRFIIKGLFSDLKELSTGQQTVLLKHFMKGKVLGKGDMVGAIDAAVQLQRAEYALKNGNISKKEYNEERHNLLRKYSVPDLDFQKVYDPEYCFENVVEYSFFKNNRCSSVSWLRDDSTYLDLLNLAMQQSEDKHYDIAIQTYNNALQHNPVGLNARYGLINAYIQLDHYQEAESELKTLGMILYDMDQDASSYQISRYYQLYGFILTVGKKYILAYSSYKYSLLFYEEDTVYDELAYIKKCDTTIDFYRVNYRDIIKSSDLILFPVRQL